MICSIWKIEFLPASGSPIVLLDFDDQMNEEPDFETSQTNASSSAIFLPFGSNYAMGGAQNAASWSRRRKFRNNHYARTAGMFERQSFPWGVQGSMRVTIRDGTTWTYARSVLISMRPIYPTSAKNGWLEMHYNAQFGAPTLSAGSVESIYAPVTPYLLWEEEVNLWDTSGSWDELILL